MDGVANGATPCAGPSFPQVLANLYSAKSKAPLFSPYQIITKTLSATAPDGSTVQVPVKIGIIGFTPPTIMSWDKRWLDGKVYTQGIVETATQFIPEMRSKGADLIVAISHGGLDNSTYTADMENGNWHLSKVAGIDAMLIGHSHQVFPNATSTVTQFNLPGVDKVKGTVNGVPTVMANFWGKHLGVVKFQLVHNGSKWTVDTTGTTVEARSTQNADKTYVAVDATVAPTIAALGMCLVLVGAFNGAANAAIGPLYVLRPAEADRGKVLASINGVSRAGSILALGLGGLVGSWLGPRVTFVGGGVLALLVVAALARALRGVDQSAPSGEMDQITVPAAE